MVPGSIPSLVNTKTAASRGRSFSAVLAPVPKTKASVVMKAIWQKTKHASDFAVTTQEGKRRKERDLPFFFFFCGFLELFGQPTSVSRPWPSTLAVNEDGQGHCDVTLWFLNTLVVKPWDCYHGQLYLIIHRCPQEPLSIFIYGQWVHSAAILKNKCDLLQQNQRRKWPLFLSGFSLSE